MTVFPPGNELNARELATLTLVAAGLAYTLTKPGTASAFGQVLRALSSRWIAGPIAGMVLWIGLAVWVASRAQLWTADLIKDSVEWFFLSAMLLYINLMRSTKDPGYFRGALLDNLKLTAFFAFYVNVFVFNYPIELGLVLMATLLAGCSVVAEYRPEAKAAKRLCDGLLLAVGIVLVVYSTQQILSNWWIIDFRHQLRLLVLPLWLTAALLPYLYAWSLFASYQMTISRVGFWAPQHRVSRRAQLAMMLILNFRVRAVANLSSPWVERLASAPTLANAIAVLRDYLANLTVASKEQSIMVGVRAAHVTPAIPIPGIRQILERDKAEAQGEAASEES